MTGTYHVTVTPWDGPTVSYDVTDTTHDAAHAAAKAQYAGAKFIDVAPVEARFAGQSDAFRAEHPWCGWVLAFAHGSDWDTTIFGLEKLVGINVLLTTADGQSRAVNITKWQHIDPAYLLGDQQDCDRRAGILAHVLDTEGDWEKKPDTLPVFVPYEDIREIVVY